MSFGASLRRERELRGITLDEISRSTKVSLRLLEAIENDRLDILPVGVFRKSFVKSYAKYLGMNEEQVLQEYALQFQQTAASPAGADKSSDPLGLNVASLNRPAALMILIVGLLILAGGIYWYLSDNGASDPARTGPVPAGSSPASPIAAPASVTVSQPSANSLPGAAPSGVPNAGPAPSLKVLGELAKKPEPASVPDAGEAAAPAESGPLELTIEATAETWLSVNTGGKTVFSGLMYSRQSRKFPLQLPLKLVLGNAGGVKLQVNGQALAGLGRPGEVRAIEISAENYQQFLAVPTP
jgi:cytoskeleton protein RodZ